MMISRGLFGWSPPHIQPLTPVSEVSEPPESPSPYLDAGADAIQVEDELHPEETEELLFAYADYVDWLLMILGSIAAAVHGASLPVYLHFLGKIINLFGLSHSSVQNETHHQLIHELLKHSLYITYIAAAVLLAGWIEVSCWIYTAERQSSVIRSKYVQVLLSQDMGFFDTYGSNDDIVSQVSSDVLFIQYTLSEKVGHYIHNMATFFGGLAVGFINKWQVSLLTLATGPFIVAAGGVSNVFLHKLAEQVQDAYSEAANIAEQAITYVRTMYAFVNETLAKYLYANALQTTLKYGVKISRVQGIGLGFIYGLAICSCALQLWFGRTLIDHDLSDGSEVIVAVFAIILSGLGLNQAATNFHAFEQSRIAAYRLYDMIERIPASPLEGKVLPNLQGGLELRNVYFSYPSRPDIPILSGLYLSLPARRTMALVGSSGSGRSSIVSLILRFYDPNFRYILLDGENLKNLRLDWLRSQVGLVSSEPALFAASIDEIEEAAKIAHAHTFISSLPDGYETQVGPSRHEFVVVGEGGRFLSEEFRLKLAIARAVLKNPCILLLDEATCNLDAQAERSVQEAIDILILGRSTLLIAHRLASIRNVDAIAVIEDGQLVEMGTHEELLGIDGSYADLLRLEENTKPARRSKSYRELNIPVQAGSSSPRLVKSSSLHRHSSARATELISMYSSPPQESAPSVKGQDSLESSLTALPKLNMRALQRHPSNHSDPESPVSPLLITDPKNERSHSKTYTRSIGQLVELETDIESPQDVLSEKPSLWRLARLSAPQWLCALLGCIGAALFGSFNPLLAYLVVQVAEAYYEFPRKHFKHEVNKWCLFMVAMGIATVFVNFLQHFYFGIMGEKMTERVRRMMFSAILRNEIGWFDKEENSTEALSIRLANDATFVRAAFSNRLLFFVQDTTAIVVVIIITIIMEWRLAVVALATIPLLAAAAVAQRMWVIGFSGDIKESHKKASVVVEEAVRNIYMVVSFSAETKVLELYKKHLGSIQIHSFVRGLMTGLAFGASQFLLFGSNAFLLWYGHETINKHQADLHAILKVYLIFSFATFALVEPFGLAPYILKRRKSLISVFEVIDRKPKIDPDDAAGLRLPNVYGTIELRNVDFSYPTRPDLFVLQSFNLKATGGQTVAIIGASGSGKSTVIALLERFYDPIAGSVMLDGKDIRSLNLRWLRSHLGLVQQEPVLFSTTIRENIIYAKRNATEAEMKEAARIANAHHFISSLPHGYDTHIGMRGLDLTAGQKQRIAIARVVLKNAPILLLDEASSSIESESSRVVQEALDTMIMGNKTTIVIAHRIATMKRVDMVAVLHDGQIVEEGTHDTLIAEGGLYARLMQPQISKPLRHRRHQ
ncbi:hypothetical protein O6H91_Y563500 [Diphasiastrum complanatum]|nr:hypothetical protein O6H91_Y563500 [Diphasiastrum complanatum]